MTTTGRCGLNWTRPNSRLRPLGRSVRGRTAPFLVRQSTSRKCRPDGQSKRNLLNDYFFSDKTTSYKETKRIRKYFNKPFGRFSANYLADFQRTIWRSTASRRQKNADRSDRATISGTSSLSAALRHDHPSRHHSPRPSFCAHVARARLRLRDAHGRRRVPRRGAVGRGRHYARDRHLVGALASGSFDSVPKN